MSELRAAIEQLRAGWLGDPGAMDRVLAEDVVIEVPFGPDGGRRFVGRDEWLAFAGPAREHFPVRFDEFRELACHQSVDPGVAVLEYELGGVVTTTGRRARARFIGVLQVRGREIVGWREYQDTAAIAAALAG